MNNPLDHIPAMDPTDPRKRGPHRMVILDCPSAAQIRAIPLDSDVVYTTKEDFAAGPWHEAIRDDMALLAERHGGSLHGAYVAYLPPAPDPNDRSVHDIVAEVLRNHFGIVNFDHVNVTEKELVYMLTAAATRAREGMAPLPF